MGSRSKSVKRRPRRCPALYQWPGLPGLIEAYTRGEARAVVKKRLRLDRLPVGQTPKLIRASKRIAS